MKKINLVILASFILSSSLQAALPPLYQGIAEQKAILMSDELGHKLHSGEIIEEIHKTPDGYEMITNHNRLRVDVIYQPVQRPGPIPFKLKFHDPHPLEKR